MEFRRESAVYYSILSLIAARIHRERLTLYWKQLQVPTCVIWKSTIHWSVKSGLFLLQSGAEEYGIGCFSLIGNWWDSKGENGIDIVALNRIGRQARIAEVKINPGKISLHVLERKAQKLLGELKRYSIEYRGYSYLFHHPGCY